VPENSRKIMEMALEIAFSRMGKTSPNPPVGAVIVKNGEIVSTGGTFPCGYDHAEVCAIKNAGRDLSGAEMFVSLEPCCHRSKKTPPCTDAIINANISRVYVPLFDPNPSVSGKGAETLRNAGIEVVIMSDMAGKAFDLIRPFTRFITKNKPFVIHKSAMTLDGRIASQTGDSKWISSEYSRYIAHKLRAKADAVIIGKNTMTSDNPSLNIRLDSFPAEVKGYFKENLQIIGKESFFLEMLLKSEEDISVSPLRVLIGLPEKIDITKNFFKDDNFLIFESRSKEEVLQNDNSDLRNLIGADKIVFVEGNTKAEQAGNILNELGARGKILLLLEGGGGIAGSFLAAGGIDQFLYFIAPRIIGEGTSVIKTSINKTISEAQNLHDISIALLKDDLLYNAYLEPVSGLYGGKPCLQD